MLILPVGRHWRRLQPRTNQHTRINPGRKAIRLTIRNFYGSLNLRPNAAGMGYFGRDVAFGAGWKGPPKNLVLRLRARDAMVLKWAVSSV